MDIDISGLKITEDVKQAILLHVQLENPFGLRSKFGNVMLFVPHKKSCVSIHNLGLTFTEYTTEKQLQNMIQVALIGHREFLNETKLLDNGKVQGYLASEKRQAKVRKAIHEKRQRLLGEKSPKQNDDILPAEDGTPDPDGNS